MALAASAGAPSPALVTAALVVTVSGILCFQATFRALPFAFPTGRAAAAGLALIVSIDDHGGFAGPFAIKAPREGTSGFPVPLRAIAASCRAAR